MLFVFRVFFHVLCSLSISVDLSSILCVLCLFSTLDIPLRSGRSLQKKCDEVECGNVMKREVVRLCSSAMW